MSSWRKILYSWGTMLGLIPFMAMLIYGAVVVDESAKGAAARSVASWLWKETAYAVILLVVVVVLGALIARRR